MRTQQRHHTPDEYLAQEEVAEFRSEYQNGEIVPMTGGSINHNQIAGNVYAFLKLVLRGKNFKPYISNLRLWMPHCQEYAYPDVVVISGKPIFQPPRTDTILNPCLIIEVLSKATKDRDRTEKFHNYRSISEFQEYLLIEQSEVAIEHYTKTQEDSWLFRSYESNIEKIFLAALNLEISLVDIYEGVDFSLRED